MMQSKDIIRSKLDEIRLFLKQFSSLLNTHAVNFITDNHWDNTIPADLKEEFLDVGLDCMLKKLWQFLDDPASKQNVNINSKLVQHFAEAQKMCITSLPKFCLSLDDFNEKLAALNCEEPTNLKYSRLMSEKKSYEIDIMSRVVASLASLMKSSHIVDIGGGKGYLSSNLTLQHKLKVLSIDSSKGNTYGAAKRLEKLEKVWDVVKYQAEHPNDSKKGKNWKSKRKIPASESNSSSDASGSTVNSCLFKQKTEFITSSTNLSSILEEAFPDADFSNTGLVGLHTCGDLAAAHLRIFINNLKSFKFSINVGCCYHLLNEEFTEDTFWNNIKSCIQNKSDPGFPMSSYLRSEEFFLSRNPRMLACQSPERVLSERILPTEPLFYRSLLQVLLLKKSGGVEDFPKGLVGKLAVKCKTFNEYAKKALKKLGTNYTVTDEELDELHDSHYYFYNRIKLFYLLRVGLSPVLESLILLDRLLFLHEQGVNNSFVVQMFDPVKSPRCYSIIAIRDSYSVDELA